MTELEQEIAHLEELRAKHRKNIRTLEEMLANYGMERPLPLLNNLDFEREQLRQVEERLAELAGQAGTEEMPADTVEPAAGPRGVQVSVTGSGAAAVGEQAVAAGEGGVAVGGDVVHGDKVDGDKVTGDKVTVSTHVRDVHGGTVITAGRDVTYRAGAASDELSVVFAAFLQELQARADLSPQDKAEVEGEVKALEATLKSDEPDLGTVQRVKRFFREKGGWPATAGLALFSNPSVVAVVQAATKRLMGG
jgi:hypothetical protein